jgi:hypothetical protein
MVVAIIGGVGRLGYYDPLSFGVKLLFRPYKRNSKQRRRRLSLPSSYVKHWPSWTKLVADPAYTHSRQKKK